MSYLANMTRAERIAAEEIAGVSISDVEVASKILGSTWEEYFVKQKQEMISPDEAEELGRKIYISLRLINAAIKEYHLAVGHYLEQSTELFVEYAAHVTKVIEAEKAFEAARVAGCFDSIKKAQNLDNESAIGLLTAAVMSQQAVVK